MPKFSFKSGLVVFVIGVVIAFVIWPLTYDHYGEGAQLTRGAVISSIDIKRDCGDVKDFLIIPWQLSLDDTDASGELKIGYWFWCGDAFSTVSAKFHHHGGSWVVDGIEAHTSKHFYDLTPKN